MDTRMAVVSVLPHLTVQWWPPHTILSGLPITLASNTVLLTELAAASPQESLTTTMPPKPTILLQYHRDAVMASGHIEQLM